jgi:Xaa-Pro dipeptidase
MCLTDNILITEGGCENLTPTPKEVDELKAIIAGS